MDLYRNASRRHGRRSSRVRSVHVSRWQNFDKELLPQESSRYRSFALTMNIRRAEITFVRDPRERPSDNRFPIPLGAAFSLGGSFLAWYARHTLGPTIRSTRSATKTRLPDKETLDFTPRQSLWL